jgi:ABC-type glutathione transport system ATPase component
VVGAQGSGKTTLARAAADLGPIRPDLARQVVKQADEILKPAKDSLVKRDLQRLQEEATPATVK